MYGAVHCGLLRCHCRTDGGHVYGPVHGWVRLRGRIDHRHRRHLRSGAVQSHWCWHLHPLRGWSVRGDSDHDSVHVHGTVHCGLLWLDGWTDGRHVHGIMHGRVRVCGGVDNSHRCPMCRWHLQSGHSGDVHALCSRQVRCDRWSHSGHVHERVCGGDVQHGQCRGLHQLCGGSVRVHHKSGYGRVYGIVHGGVRVSSGVVIGHSDAVRRGSAQPHGCWWLHTLRGWQVWSDSRDDSVRVHGAV